MLFLCDLFSARCENESVQLGAVSKFGFFFFHMLSLWNVLIFQSSAKILRSVNYSSHGLTDFLLKEMLYAVRCLKSNEDMILALAGQFKQLSHEPEKCR